MTEQEIINTVEELLTTAATKFGWIVNQPNLEIYFFRNKKATAGICKSDCSALGFNLDVAELHPTKFRDTIIHEVSHLIQLSCYSKAKQFHGPEFRRINVLLGGNGSTTCTYHKIEADMSKYIEYTCPCHDEHYISKIKHGKIVRGEANYRCSKCHNRIFKKD